MAISRMLFILAVMALVFATLPHGGFARGGHGGGGKGSRHHHGNGPFAGNYTLFGNGTHTCVYPQGTSVTVNGTTHGHDCNKLLNVNGTVNGTANHTHGARHNHSYFASAPGPAPSFVFRGNHHRGRGGRHL
eukprot:SM000079S22464  [mRNA]  locus=s79:371100:371745:- [translate_table: standard]